MSEPTTNPYLGPRTFEERHAHLFFGREREARDLLSTVISEPLVMFYAPSGAGKSSLINARLVPGLRHEGFHVLPIGRLGRTLSDDPSLADNICVYNLLASLDQGEKAAQDIAHTSLQTYLERTRETLSDPATPLVLIIDQFEEIITSYQAYWRQRESFFRQLYQALEADSLLWVVLSLREDYLAAIEPYALSLPGPMFARFQMQRMRYPAALDAIRQPAADHGRPFAEGVAAILVDNLRQIRAHDDQGQRMGEFVEPVQLQVVCYQLWENLKDRPAAEITAEDVAKLGDVDTALGDFYEGAIGEVLAAVDLSELDLRNWFESKLITEDKTRGTVYQGPDETAGLPNEAVRQLADRYLLRSELRAGGSWYELVHDRLVSPILQSNAAWRDAQGPVLKAAEEWLAANRSPDHLYEGAQLKEAVARLDESTAEPLVKEFLAASQIAQREREEEQARMLAEAQAEAERQKQRAEEQSRTSFRLRLLAIGLLLVLAAAVALGVFAYGQSIQASQANATSTRLLAQAVESNNNFATARAASVFASTAVAVAEAKAAEAIGLAASQNQADQANAARGTAEAAAYEAGISIATANGALFAADATATRLASGPSATQETPAATATTAVAVTSEVQELSILPPRQHSMLKVPYKSQWASDAASHRSDDGPAALSMLLGAAGIDVTVDRVYDYFEPKASDDPVSVRDLLQAAAGNGVEVAYATEEGVNDAMALLRASIDDGIPFIALVKYEPWQPVTGSAYTAGHYVLVVGYDDENVYVHDSLLGTTEAPNGGAYFQLPNELFAAGWGGFSLQENPNWAGIYPTDPLSTPLDLAVWEMWAATLSDRGANVLPVPFRSQWADDAQTHSADGGPTAMAMLLNAAGIDITPDGLYDHMRPMDAKESATTGDLIEAAKSNGIAMEYVQAPDAEQAEAQLREAIDDGKPFLALVKYDPWRDVTGNDFKWGAFVLVVGYDSEKVYLHDPLFGLWAKPATQGAYFEMDRELFFDAWGGFPVTENPNWTGIYPAEPVIPPSS